MRLSAWDVVWPWDGLVDPPNFKLWACVEPERLWFLRINTKPDKFGAVSLTRAEQSFLEHDSWFACGGDLVIIRESEFQEALEQQRNPGRRGILGSVCARVRGEIIVGIRVSPRLSVVQKDLIIRRLKAD